MSLLRLAPPAHESGGSGSIRGSDGEVGTMADNGAAAGGGAIYALGIFGAWVYFWQAADGFGERAYAIFQGLFWPAYMVYDAFAALAS